MARGKSVGRSALALVCTMLAAVFTCTTAFAQGARGEREAPPTPRSMAPADLTGTWEAIVVEDWRYRMLPPLRYQDSPPRLGEQYGIPINAEARQIALSWDPDADEAAGEACRAYGAPNIMRLPGRIRISWQDDQTLKLETEAGTQTRLLEFGHPMGQAGGWQGVTRASWPHVPGGRGNAPGPALTGSLLLETSGLRPGYLQKNGIPYSENATMTEYFARIDEDNGDSYLVVTTTVTDPTYLREPYLTTTHFKKLPDRSRWNPSPCSVR